MACIAFGVRCKLKMIKRWAAPQYRVPVVQSATPGVGSQPAKVELGHAPPDMAGALPRERQDWAWNCAVAARPVICGKGHPTTV